MGFIDKTVAGDRRNSFNTTLDLWRCAYRRPGKEVNMGLLRKPENSNGSTAYNPWLTPEVFSKSGKGMVNLLGTMRASNSQFGEGIVLDVKVNGSMFSWTVKYSSGNYSRLHKRFGDSEKKWNGPVKVEVKEYMGKAYIAVV
jgi:hypothetical protein